MSILKTARALLFGKPEEEEECPEIDHATPYTPKPGEFFDPVPRSWEGSSPTVMAAGPARIEVGRLGARSFRLLRRVGYRDPKSGEIWVVPRELDEWKLNFSSAPVLVNWIIPVLGSHFNAFVLHDALVEDKLFRPTAAGDQQGDGYYGNKVSREEADRIARDAMRAQGTGFLRRWIAWAGTMIGTIFSKEGIAAPNRRGRYLALFVLYIVGLAALGIYSSGEVLGWWQNLPWMKGEGWFTRLLFGGLGAVVTPALLSVLWGSRWRFALIAGLLLAGLLPALVITAALSMLYLEAERFFKWVGYTKKNPCTLKPVAFGRRD